MGQELLSEWFEGATEEELRAAPRLKDQVTRLLGELAACRNAISKRDREKTELLATLDGLLDYIDGDESQRAIGLRRQAEKARGA